MLKFNELFTWRTSLLTVFILFSPHLLKRAKISDFYGTFFSGDVNSLILCLITDGCIGRSIASGFFNAFILSKLIKLLFLAYLELDWICSLSLLVLEIWDIWLGLTPPPFTTEFSLLLSLMASLEPILFL